jgi:crotonobetainyl-CoA:carnitine CoA-transferase CaiB-like acyl-CoA transferase
MNRAGVRAPHRPLAGLKVSERFGPKSTDVGRTTVSLAGLLALLFGADVVRAQDPSTDPMKNWSPSLPDGSSATFTYLAACKTFRPEPYPAAPCTFLLTDDETCLEGWPRQRVVLVTPALDLPVERPQSELTLMAAAGLLDIVGEQGRPPLSLPGYQVGYTAGLAAFISLMTMFLVELRGGAQEPATVGALDVLAWTNWKNRLANVSGHRETGIARKEEWFVARCVDGYVAVIYLDRNMPALAELVGSPRLSDDVFQTIEGRVANIRELKTIISKALSWRTRADVLRDADRLGLPFSSVLDPRDVPSDPQHVARRFIVADRDLLRPRLPLLWDGLPLATFGGAP